jgi:hypothetical protein
LTKVVAKSVGLSVHDLVASDCGHYNKGQTLKTLGIEEDFDGISRRLMKV